MTYLSSYEDNHYHSPPPPRYIDQATQTRVFECQYCDSELTSKAHLLHHELIHTVVYECIWPECSNRFTSRRDYKKHMDAHTTERFLPCAWCSKSFNNQKQYEAHVKEHIDKPLLPCDQCPAKFDQNVKLRYHEKMHAAAKFVHVLLDPKQPTVKMQALSSRYHY